jgi:formate-dependent nitrite reductase membrane component NrfD
MKELITNPLFWIGVIVVVVSIFLLVRWIYRDSQKIDKTPWIRMVIAVFCGLKLRNLVLYLILRRTRTNAPNILGENNKK